MHTLCDSRGSTPGAPPHQRTPDAVLQRVLRWLRPRNLLDLARAAAAGAEPVEPAVARRLQQCLHRDDLRHVVVELHHGVGHYERAAAPVEKGALRLTHVVCDADARRHQQALPDLVGPRHASLCCRQLPGWLDAKELGRQVQREAPLVGRHVHLR
eukprot:365457-Chlamydomonas_euryale.AAC.2